MEKKAVSEPDTIAEAAINNINATKETPTSKENPL